MRLLYILVFAYVAFDLWCIIRERRVMRFQNKIKNSLFNEKWTYKSVDEFIQHYKVASVVWDKWSAFDMYRSATPLKLENWYTPEEIGVILKYSNEEF